MANFWKTYFFSYRNYWKTIRFSFLYGVHIKGEDCLASHTSWQGWSGLWRWLLIFRASLLREKIYVKRENTLVQTYRDLTISPKKILLGSLQVFIMASAYLPKAKHSFGCNFGGKAVQCSWKDFQYEQENFGSACNDSRDNLTKHPDTKPVSFAFICLISSRITRHYFMHVVIFSEIITFTI